MSAVFGENNKQFAGVCAEIRDPDDRVGIGNKKTNADEVEKIQACLRKSEKVAAGLGLSLSHAPSCERYNTSLSGSVQYKLWYKMRQGE